MISSITSRALGSVSVDGCDFVGSLSIFFYALLSSGVCWYAPIQWVWSQWCLFVGIYWWVFVGLLQRVWSVLLDSVLYFLCCSVLYFLDSVLYSTWIVLLIAGSALVLLCSCEIGKHLKGYELIWAALISYLSALSVTAVQVAVLLLSFVFLGLSSVLSYSWVVLISSIWIWLCPYEFGKHLKGCELIWAGCILIWSGLLCYRKRVCKTYFWWLLVICSYGCCRPVLI